MSRQTEAKYNVTDKLQELTRMAVYPSVLQNGYVTDEVSRREAIFAYRKLADAKLIADETNGYRPYYIELVGGEEATVVINLSIDSNAVRLAMQMKKGENSTYLVKETDPDDENAFTVAVNTPIAHRYVRNFISNKNGFFVEHLKFKTFETINREEQNFFIELIEQI